jgi:putative membrane protein
MKHFVRAITLYSLSLYLLPILGFGVVIKGGFGTLVAAGIVLSLMMFVVKPIMNLISIPLNFFSMGMFSTITNGIILYLLTIFVTNVQVVPFSTHAFSLFGIQIPGVHFNQFFALFACAVVLSLIDGLISWLTEA